MIDIKKIDDELYIDIYGLPKEIGDASALWNKIKRNPDILRKAVKIRRNKWNDGDLVNGLTISSRILIDYAKVDQVAYDELIKSIYTNRDIARIVIEGGSNGGYSFLLMSLWNHSLKLTEEQKSFAVNEAMNKIGITMYDGHIDEYEQKLDIHGTGDNITTMVDIHSWLPPIHGIGAFDIRYHILRNPNWTLEEKQRLIMDFWCNDDDYAEHLEQWERRIVNDYENYKGALLPPFGRYELFNKYSYEMLLKFYKNQETTDRIWYEIQFCKQMRELRSPKGELESSSQSVLTYCKREKEVKK